MPSARINPLVETLAAPPIPEVQAWKKEYDGRLGPLIDLSQAVPGYPPHPDMLGWLGEAAGSVAMAGYGDIEGEPALRAAFATWVSDIYAADITPANIQITSGCNQAFMAAMMAVAGPGDTVLLTNPCYFNHETTLAMSGVKVGYVDCHAADGFLPTPAAVEAMITEGVRALAVVTPNNPTGATYPAGLLRELFEICRKQGIWMVVDETYRDFLPQAALAKAIPALCDWRRANTLEISARSLALTEVMADAQGWEIAAIGAYFAFVRHPFPDLSSHDAAHRLAQEAGVITIPGSFFGNGLERYLRVAFANADVGTIRQLGTRFASCSR
jgi:aspartate/methionine/tyrosine aminotransferase